MSLSTLATQLMSASSTRKEDLLAKALAQLIVDEPDLDYDRVFAKAKAKAADIGKAHSFLFPRLITHGHARTWWRVYIFPCLGLGLRARFVLRRYCRLFRDVLPPPSCWIRYPHPKFDSLHSLAHHFNEVANKQRWERRRVQRWKERWEQRHSQRTVASMKEELKRRKLKVKSKSKKADLVACLEENDTIAATKLQALIRGYAQRKVTAASPTAEKEAEKGPAKPVVVVFLGNGLHKVKTYRKKMVSFGRTEFTDCNSINVNCSLTFVGESAEGTIVEGGFNFATHENDPKDRVIVAGLESMTVLKSISNGVTVGKAAKLDATECHFHHNRHSGVEVEEFTATAHLTNCTFHNNKYDGVIATSGAVVDLMGEGTSVRDNGRYGLVTFHSGTTISVYQPCVLNDMCHGNMDGNIQEHGGIVQQIKTVRNKL